MDNHIQVALRVRAVKDLESELINLQISGNELSAVKSVQLMDIQSKTARPKPLSIAIDQVFPNRIVNSTLDEEYQSTSAASASSTAEFLGAEETEIHANMGQRIVDEALEGYNTSIISCGQKSVGKTSTMLGIIPVYHQLINDGLLSKRLAHERGVVPRVCESVLERIDWMTRSHFKISCTMSFHEIFGERAIDLLYGIGRNVSPLTGSKATTSGKFTNGGDSLGRNMCRVRENPLTGVFIDGSTNVPVMSGKDVFRVLVAAYGQRAAAVTRSKTNLSHLDPASRGEKVVPASARKVILPSDEFLIGQTHTMISLDIDWESTSSKPAKRATSRRQVECDTRTCRNTMRFFDLVGVESDRIGGVRKIKGSSKESAWISKSLMSLSKVVSVLAQHQDTPTNNVSAPYKDNILTLLLKSSIGGNAKTTVLAMIRPEKQFEDGTCKTLRFAAACRRIVNEPEKVINVQRFQGFSQSEAFRQSAAGEFQRVQHSPIQNDGNSTLEGASTIDIEPVNGEDEKLEEDSFSTNSLESRGRVDYTALPKELPPPPQPSSNISITNNLLPEEATMIPANDHKEKPDVMASKSVAVAPVPTLNTTTNAPVDATNTRVTVDRVPAIAPASSVSSSKVPPGSTTLSFVPPSRPPAVQSSYSKAMARARGRSNESREGAHYMLARRSRSPPSNPSNSETHKERKLRRNKSEQQSKGPMTQEHSGTTRLWKNNDHTGQRNYGSSNLELRQQVTELQEQMYKLERNFSRISEEKQQMEGTMKQRERDLNTQISTLTIELEKARGKIAVQNSTVKKLEQQLIDTPLIPRALNNIAAERAERAEQAFNESATRGRVFYTPNLRSGALTKSSTITLKGKEELKIEESLSTAAPDSARGTGDEDTSRLPLYERVRRYRMSLDASSGVGPGASRILNTRS